MLGYENEYIRSDKTHTHNVRSHPIYRYVNKDKSTVL